MSTAMLGYTNEAHRKGTAMLGYTNEAYRKGDIVIVVHERRGGEVFYHVQRFRDLDTHLGRFHRTDDAQFDAERIAEGFQSFDVNELPAAVGA